MSFFLNKFTVHLKLIIMKVIINNLIYAKRSEKSLLFIYLLLFINSTTSLTASSIFFSTAFSAVFTYDNSYRNTDKVSVFELNAGSFVSVVKQYFYSLYL